MLKNKSVPVIYIPCDILRNFQAASPSAHMGFPPPCSITPFFSDSAASRCPLTCQWPSEYVTGRMDHSTAGVSEPHMEYHELLIKFTWMYSGPSPYSESTVSMTHCPFYSQCLANMMIQVVLQIALLGSWAMFASQSCVSSPRWNFSAQGFTSQLPFSCLQLRQLAADGAALLMQPSLQSSRW